MNVSGHIFSIKQFSTHDGPHIRTTVFFKGCPLGCWWCHNPEGLTDGVEMVFNRENCIRCGDCIANCPQQALVFSSKGVERDLHSCTRCGNCSEICPACAHEVTGWKTTTREVMEQIEKDTPFYDQSGGGVTFSGGEPMSQPEFLLSLLKECGNLSIHRAVDTSLYVPTKSVSEIAAQTDLFLCDIKHMDSRLHKHYTGVGNELILNNIRLLLNQGSAMRMRIPLIPGINDDDKNLQDTAAFISDTAYGSTIDLLPYHRAARAKYNKLSVPYPGNEISSVDNRRIAHAVALFNKFGLTVQVGG
jgi:pyruvate formate lyase activating enzyme